MQLHCLSGASTVKSGCMDDDSITVTHGPAYSSTAQSDVELSNRIWRGAMRRVLHTRDAEKKNWGQLMTLVNEIVNSRPNSKLGGRSPAEVFTKAMSGDTELIKKVSESVLKSANAKRQPSKITPLSQGAPGLVHTWDMRDVGVSGGPCARALFGAPTA
eukprot:COSAG06_NODE_54_length_27948_cov_234.398671_10_plen_159_part_00